MNKWAEIRNAGDVFKTKHDYESFFFVVVIDTVYKHKYLTNNAD